MYVKRSEEEDNRLADRWESDAAGILIFVRPNLETSVITPYQLGNYRLVCSLLL
jgi:hypothetical protein